MSGFSKVALRLGLTEKLNQDKFGNEREELERKLNRLSEKFLKTFGEVVNVEEDRVESIKKSLRMPVVKRVALKKSNELEGIISPLKGNNFEIGNSLEELTLMDERLRDLINKRLKEESKIIQRERTVLIRELGDEESSCIEAFLSNDRFAEGVLLNSNLNK